MLSGSFQFSREKITHSVTASRIEYLNFDYGYADNTTVRE